MTAEDEEGGEGEVWEILEAMGYNKRLELDQVRDNWLPTSVKCVNANYLTCIELSSQIVTSLLTF